MQIQRIADAIEKIVLCADGIFRNVISVDDKFIRHNFKTAANGSWVFGVETERHLIEHLFIFAEAFDAATDKSLVDQKEKSLPTIDEVQKIIRDNKPTIPHPFVVEFDRLAKQAHATAKKSGWWDEKQKVAELIHAHAPELESYFQGISISSEISLCVTELSEAVENTRMHQEPDDKVPEFTGLEAELADCLIRIFDIAEARGLRVAEAVVAKMAMNTGRPRKHGGKLF